MRITLPLLPIFLAVAFLLILAACGEPANMTDRHGNRPPQYLKGESQYDYPITYFKDDRTGICFAERRVMDYHGYSFTEVPCEKVDIYFNRPK